MILREFIYKFIKQLQNYYFRTYIKIDHIIRLLSSYDIKLLLRISQLFSLITHIIGHFRLNLKKISKVIGLKEYAALL